MLYSALVQSPLGEILLEADEVGLAGLYFSDQADSSSNQPKAKPSDGLLNNILLRTYEVLLESKEPDLFSDNIQVSNQAVTHKPLCDTKQDYAAIDFINNNAPSIVKDLLNQTAEELNSYWHHDLQEFTVPLNPSGSSFQKKIWEALLLVKLGKTLSYGALGDVAGYGKKHGRAVGTAVGSNPISIIIPCHRILAANNTLNGYGGGLNRKLKLLQHEGLNIGLSKHSKKTSRA